MTHDRYFLDNVAGWILELDRGAGIPWEGNYSSWLEQKQARLAAEEKADRSRQASLERELEWIRMSPRARQSKGKARINAYNDLVAEAEGRRAARRQGRAVHPAGAPAGRPGGGGGRRRQGVRRPTADRRPVLHAAAGRHRRRHRPERRRQDDAVPDDRRGGAAGRRHARPRCDGRSWPTSTSRASALAARPHRVRRDHRGSRPPRGRRSRAARPRLCRRVRFQGQRPAEDGGPALGR